MMAQGTWWLRSEIDPSWNLNGEGMVGMFMTVESCAPARAFIEAMKQAGKEPPADLEFGYMKD